MDNEPQLSFISNQLSQLHQKDSGQVLLFTPPTGIKGLRAKNTSGAKTFIIVTFVRAHQYGRTNDKNN